MPLGESMPDIILPGSAGRIEARYQRQKNPGAPMALVLHPHPQFGGAMNNPLVYDLFHMFHGLGCSTVRFNFRGVGRSQGTFDSGAGELSDAAAVLDWMNTLYPTPSHVWVCGISFGAWIGMQLLMRRPEITGFVSIAPPASMYDFAFLAPRPASGLIVHGTKDSVVPEPDVQKLVDRLTAQKGIKIAYDKIEGANHFFDRHESDVLQSVEAYVSRMMGVTAPVKSKGSWPPSSEFPLAPILFAPKPFMLNTLSFQGSPDVARGSKVSLRISSPFRGAWPLLRVHRSRRVGQSVSA